MTTVPVPLALASDQADSPAFSSQRLVNLFAEISALGGKSPFLLRGTPGLKPFTTAGTGPGRGDVMMAGTAYIVSGQSLFRIDSNATTTNLGAIDGQGPVSMATAGTQIAVATSENNGFIYDSSTGVTQQITSANFYGGTSVIALDGYFLWSSSPTYVNRFQISALLDGLTYDALDFASAESTATTLKRVFLVGSQIFMMKPDRIEVWYDSGNADFPFARLNSTVILKGLAGKFSPAQLDNTLFWVGQESDGGGPVVYRANGYVPQVISSHAVARALAEVDNLDLIVGIAYTKENHAFYGMIFPNGNAWFYDAANGLWHERTTYGYDRWLGNCLIDAYGKSLVGSFLDGAIYELDLDTYTDAGTIPLIAEATLPNFGTDPSRKRCSRLRLDMQTGVGLITGNGSDPIVSLAVSDDRGQIWSSEMQASIGKIGDYGLGVEWNRLGQFRSRVHRFRISDPVKRIFIALYADIS